ncbi:hypothetical protein MTO96_034160 [Rhipicephalus appendiculatus]
MDRRADRKRRTKYWTKHAYGKRKRKPPVRKTKRSAAIESDEPRTASPPSQVSSEADTCSLPMLGSEAYDAGPSTSRDITVQFERDRSLVSVAADDYAVPALRNDGESTAGSEAYDPGPSTSRDIAVRLERESSFVFAAAGDDAVPAVQNDGESMPGSDTEDPGPSTRRGIAERCERERSFVFAAADDDVVPAVQDVGDRLPRRKRTVQVHLEPRFVSSEAAEKQASSVRDALREVSATERKFGLAQQTEQASAPKDDEFTLIQGIPPRTLPRAALGRRARAFLLRLRTDGSFALPAKGGHRVRSVRWRKLSSSSCCSAPATTISAISSSVFTAAWDYHT